MDLLEAVSRSRRGDQEALQFLFTTYYAETYRATYLLTRNAQLAEEATQEAFIKAFNRLGSLKQPEKFPGWLRVIAGRCAIDVLRREKSYYPYEDPAALADCDADPDAGVFPSPERAGERAELRAVVRQALHALEPIHRQVIVLRFYHELNINEIAAALECPVGTVKSRLHRALKALEKQLATLPEGTGEVRGGDTRQGEEEIPCGKKERGNWPA